ncbi:aromatic-ring-hydroxylating dioxygenase subunit beta [Flavisphingomonas formosensis]|uniref:aromatic-ring-hydroxylating dioxygenase subunit beta n=1 Tax=Flavisphingomonas formosensis TaxID=861534 RepID=UPI0012F7BE9C|nr:aromatic-ring-hydroxylating dioxygenase subunit beta [Sphingomonas formosensis]
MNEAFAPALDVEWLRRVEQFYYREARLLDERRYLSWLELLSPAILYLMPGRFVPLARASAADPETIHAPDKELSGYGPRALPLREEGFAHLAQRAERALKPNAWAENPPPRIRRFVANVEVEPLAGGSVRAWSNLLLFHSQQGRADHLFSAQRRDRLETYGDHLRIVEREVRLDGDTITGPSVALFF